MLDEKQEYIRLTSKQEKDCPPPLRYANLSNHLSGIEYAMTIVARGFLFADEGSTEPSTSIACTKVCLRAWCGLAHRSDAYYCLDESKWKRTDYDAAKDKPDSFVCQTNCLNERIYIEKLPDDPEGRKTLQEISRQLPQICFCHGATCKKACKQQIKNVHNWLPNYLWQLKKPEIDRMPEKEKEEGKQFFATLFPEKQTTDSNLPSATQAIKLNHSAKLNIFSILLELHSKRTQFGQHLFHISLNDTSKTKNKEVTYERIIANALNAGPLQTYLLYAGKEISSEKELFAGITKASGGKDSKNLSKANKRLILAVAAMCLMHKKREYVVFNASVLTNWLQGNLPGKGGISIFRYMDIPLFHKSLVAGNVLKLRIEPKWTENTKLGVCLAGEVPANATVIPYGYKQNSNHTGNNWDLTFKLPGGGEI